MAKDTSNKPARSRTDELRKEIDRSLTTWTRLLGSRNFLLAAAIWLGFAVIVGSTVVWTREQPKVAQGRVVSTTRIARADFRIEDEAATEQAQNSARAAAPRVYLLEGSVLDEIRAALEDLPEIAKAVSTPDEIDPGLREQFGITDAALAALKAHVVDGQTSPAWSERVRRLNQLLLRAPILDRGTFQVESAATNREIELRLDPPGDTPPEPTRILRVPTSSAMSVDSPRLEEDLRAIAATAGFTGPLLDVVTTRLVRPARPTYVFDAALTAARQEEAAAAVAPKVVSYPAGEVIYKRGEKLTQTQLNKVRQAVVAERERLDLLQRWASRLAVVGLVGAVTLALAGYTSLFVPRIRRNPTRTAAVAGLLALATVLGCWATLTQPGLIALTGVAPTIFVTVILAIAYTQRIALAYGALHGVLMCLALEQPVGTFAVLVAGIGVAVWQLREVRDRDALIRMGLFEALALSIGTFLVNLVELPPTTAAVAQAGWDAGWAGFGGLLVSGVTLYLLPTLEKAFGLVTGMTLIELRDPKQPLLRQLQQRAPGTYNHSLTIASLGEAAADAIGADGLLTYVGALYHDIGKMNKPDYFVENQAPGFNRHDKLTPAMSLLVIVGHVKDGMELAREYNLPRPVHHFIESHHGTTLVEYFFHRAKKRAEELAERGGGTGEGEEAEVPAEIEYRYPGPRPRTKEAAIVMLCDAVESASRTMADPTPSRIDQLVRSIANKRLMDGQFDECDLSLRELNTIVETVSKTLASIYHGRIQYPSTAAGATPPPGTVAAADGQGGIGSGPRTAIGITPTVGPSTMGGNGAARERAVAE